MFEIDELKHRLQSECLPLPIVFALQDDTKKPRLLHLLEGQVTEAKLEEIFKLSTNSRPTKNLLRAMKRLVRTESLKLSSIKNCKDTLELLLSSTMEDL